MNAKKVMFLLYTLSIGGAERRAATLAGEMAARGVEVQIVMLDGAKVSFEVDPRVKVVHLHTDGPVDTADNTAPVEIVECPVRKEASLLENLQLKWTSVFNKKKHAVLDLQLFLEKKYAASIRWYVKQHPDWLIVSWMSYCNVSTMDALQGLPNTAAFVECISPGAEFPDDDHPMNILKRRFYPRAAKAICQTPEQAAFYTFLNDTQVHTIPNPIRGEYPARYEGERRKEIVNFCRLAPAKNIPLLMDAFALLAPEYPEYTLSIYGEGELKEELLAYAQTLGLADRIHLHPFDTHIHEKIRDCAMFVSSSDREGISNSMLEALAIGLPTICTALAGAVMLIKPRESGLIVPLRDPVAMRDAMKEVIDNPDFANTLSENAVKLRDELTVAAITDRWMTALDLEE